MNSAELQQELFVQIKNKVLQGASVVEGIAKILSISSDSAYRRMRGEKDISFDELIKITTHFKISLDQLMNIQTGIIPFQGKIVNERNYGFEEYLTGILNTMAYFNSFNKKEFYYSCKDMPIFHHFHLRDIAAFKWFFWLKTYLQFPGFAKKKFRFADYPDNLFEIDQKVLNLYNQLPSTEIWNIESMSIFFRQIEFYRDGQVFDSDKDVLRLYEALERTWDHLKKQAALGYKINYKDPEQKPMGKFKMYFNEVLLGDNSMLVINDGVKMSFITHTTLNFMMTRDVVFTENMYTHMQNQMKRSTLISEVSEKERSRFFRIIRERIINRKNNLNV